MGNTITHLVDGRYTIDLEEDDVKLAEVYLKEGKTITQIAILFHQAGYTLSKGVDIASCANANRMKGIMRERGNRKKT